LLCKAFFFACRKVAIADRQDIKRIHTMELPLETVALFSLKLAYETEDQSPILRDDLVMSDYQRDVFGLLVRRGDVEAIQLKVAECLGLALNALGGADKPLGRELQRLSADLRHAQTMEQLDAPLIALKDYLKDIQ
jgi:hypothetical protein